MTPIEAAVKAAHECGMPSEDLFGEDFVVWTFEAAHARAIITAFLGAVAEDHDARMDVGCAAVESHERTEHPVCVGRAAILALKGAMS